MEKNKTTKLVKNLKSIKRKGMEGIGTLLIFVTTILIVIGVTTTLYMAGKSAQDKATLQSLLSNSPTKSELVDAWIIVLGSGATIDDITKLTLTNNSASNTLTLTMEANPTKATFVGYTTGTWDIDFKSDKLNNVIAESEQVYVGGKLIKTNSIDVTWNKQSVTYRIFWSRKYGYWN